MIVSFWTSTEIALTYMHVNYKHSADKWINAFILL